MVHPLSFLYTKCLQRPDFFQLVYDIVLFYTAFFSMGPISELIVLTAHSISLDCIEASHHLIVICYVTVIKVFTLIVRAAGFEPATS